MICPKCGVKVEPQFIMAYMLGLMSKTPSSWTWLCKCGALINIEDVRRAYKDRVDAADKEML